MDIIAEIRAVKTEINGEFFYHTEVKRVLNFMSVMSGARPIIGDWERIEVVDA